MAESPSTSILSFPPQAFAALAPSSFLLAHLTPSSSQTPSLRPNQRSPTSFRSPSINTSSLTHANGSAVVRLGDTAVVCGVRGEILQAEDVPQTYDDPVKSPRKTADEDDAEDANDTTAQDLGLLVPNIELSTGCSPQHVPGNAPSAIAQSLTHRLRSLLYSSRLIRPSDLRIWSQPPATASDAGAMEEEGREEDAAPKVKAYWTLYIDILFIALDGGAFDAAWGATIAALRDTKLARAWWDADREMVLCSDRMNEARNLALRGLPVSVGAGIFAPGKVGARRGIGGKRAVLRGFSQLGKTAEEEEGGAEGWLLADMDAFEQELCEEEVTVVLDCSSGKTRLLKIEKSGGIVAGMQEMMHVIRLAEERWAEWKKSLDESKR